MTARRVWRDRDGQHGQSGAGGPSGRLPGPVRRFRPFRIAERASYWLLYVVAFPAGVLHWRAGNEELAVLCALAAVAGVTSIAAPHRKS